MKINHFSKKDERGVTILIVAMSLLVLITMAALAIDVASLYQARAEAQRAADAAALAGAKMFVTSSYTSTTAINFSNVCVTGGPGSTQAANRQAEAAAKINPIAGNPAVINRIQCDNTHVGNPRVTVTVESANSPTFFAKIWAMWGSNNLGTVKATATAEAYNISGLTTPIPIVLTNVKPWFIPNCNPGGPVGPCNGASGFFINPVDGAIKDNGSFVGQILHLTRQLTPGGNVGGDGLGKNMGSTLTFYGLKYPNFPAPSCPPTGAISCNDPNINNGDTYIDNIACTSSLQMSCGMPIGPAAIPQFLIEANGPGGGPTVIGTKCLIHASGPGNNQGQDEFSTGVPVTINGGSNNPNPSLRVDNISRSDSVVTAPLYNGQPMDNSLATPSAPIIGFLQLGVRQTNGGGGPGPGPGQLLDAVILNVVGCNPNLVYPPTNPISAGGASPIPVRLVQTP